MRHHLRFPALVIALAVPLATTTGCFRYVPAPARIAEGERVRLTFTEDGAARMAARLGDGVRRVDGEMLRDAGDSLAIRLRSVDAEQGTAMTIVGDVAVTVPRDALAGVGIRRLDRPVTFIATVAGVGAIYAITQGIRGGGDGGGGDTQPPPPVQPSRRPQ